MNTTNRVAVTSVRAEFLPLYVAKGLFALLTDALNHGNPLNRLKDLMKKRGNQHEKPAFGLQTLAAR